MKKVVALLCMTMILFSCFGSGLAEETVSEGRKLTDQINQDITVNEEVPAEEDGMEKHLPEKIEDTTRAADEQRSVFIEGNSYIVEILSSLNLLYQRPANSSVVCFTQDYVQQASLYNRYYSSPIAAAFSYIEDNVFFNIYDPTSGCDIYVTVDPTAFSASYPNVAVLSDSTAAALMADIKANNFPTAVDAQYGWLGGNVYFYFNCLNNGFVDLITTVNGYQIEVYYKVKSQSDVNEGLTLLENMNIMAK